MSEMDTAIGILSTATAADSSVSAPDPAASDSPETPDTSTTVEADAVDSPESAEETPEGEGAAKPQLPTTKQVTDALKAFREANPEMSAAAKLLNDQYFRATEYQKLFSNIEDARSFKAQLDTIGGLEGLAEMQATLTSIEETDALLESGDPKIIDQIVEDSPDGFKKLAPHYLNRLEKLDPEAYGNTLKPHLVKALIDSNLAGVLGYALNKAGDNAEVKGAIQSILDWLSGQKNQAEKLNADLLNPEKNKIATEWDKLNQERRADLNTKISQGVDGHIRTELGSRLRPYSAALNALPPAQRGDVARAVMQELAKAIKADKAYQTSIQAMMNSRKPDAAKIIATNKAKVTALADAVVSKVVKDYGLKPGTQAPKKPAAATRKAGEKATPTGPVKIVKLAAAPKDSDIDWNHEHMSDGAFIRHRAVLKDGRYVSW